MSKSTTSPGGAVYRQGNVQGANGSAMGHSDGGKIRVASLSLHCAQENCRWHGGQVLAGTPKHSTMERSRGSEQQNGTTEPALPEQPGPRRSVQWNEGEGVVKPSRVSHRMHQLATGIAQPLGSLQTIWKRTSR